MSSNINYERHSRSQLWAIYKGLVLPQNRTLVYSTATKMSLIVAINEINRRQRPLISQDELQALVKARAVRINFNRLIEANLFQEVVSIIVADGVVLTNAQAINFFNRARANGRYTITLTEQNGNIQHIALNETTRDFVIQFLSNGLLLDELEQFGSDTINAFNLRGLANISISLLERPQRVIENRDGRFFPHINTTNLDLSSYQIYNQKQAYNLKDREHCLIHTLLECGVNKSQANEIKLIFKSGCNFKKTDIKHTASIIQKNIVIHSIKPDGKIKKTETLPNIRIDGKPLEKINIAIHENHYFKFEETKYTKFFINNYEKLKDEKMRGSIIRMQNNRPKYGEGKKINSLLMVEKLLKANLFGKLDMVNFEETASHKNLKEHIYLGNIGREQRKMGEKEYTDALDETNTYTDEATVIKKLKRDEARKDKEQAKKDRGIYYADCESYVPSDDCKDYDNSIHKLQLLR